MEIDKKLNIEGDVIAKQNSLEILPAIKEDPNNLGEKSKRLVCHICDQTFASSYNLRHHQEVVHEAENNYACDLCGQHFNNHHIIARHKIEKHKTKDESLKPRCEPEGIYR